MMQCPSCSATLASGEARCGACHALVNPPVQGASALAPRLVTPQNVEGTSTFLDPPSVAAGVGSRSHSASRNPAPRNQADEAWRREVLERVRKRRQVRARPLPLFVEGEPTPRVQAPEPEKSKPETPPAEVEPAFSPAAEPQRLGGEEVRSGRDRVDPGEVARDEGPDLLAAFDGPLSNEAEGEILDLPLRPAEPPGAGAAAAGEGMAAQSLVERPRPTPIGTSGSRSLVAGLPLVEPSRPHSMPQELPPRRPASAVSSRAASMSDRMQAAFIDVGIWSGMTVTAFYFASRIAHTSIVGLGPAWQGLCLFGFVLASAYILFFGGLSGATPGKIACGLQVRRYDGSSLGPLASLGRGLLGIVSVLLLGLGIWPAFWDKDRRALHDRATDSRVTTV